MTATLPGLFVRMLRYRVAAMIWLFMLLAAAFHSQPPALSVGFGAAVLALACSYVAATTLNDLADEPIDRVNHPGDRGRPLVTGEAGRGDLRVLHVLGCVGALAAAALLGRAGLAIVAVSLVIGHTYSARPVRFSYRSYLAPAVLAVAYVLVPYGLALVVADVEPRPADALFAGGLYALFLARISLKDFRDREGDRRYGRPTLLLRYGKAVTCRVSLAALAVGTLLLAVAVRPAPAVALPLALLVAGIAAQLYALWRTDEPRLEQVTIGLGAKLGNGLLIGLLGVLLLRAQGASVTAQALLAATVSVLYGASFLVLRRRPQQAIIAYKG